MSASQPIDPRGDVDASRPTGRERAADRVLAQPGNSDRSVDGIDAAGIGSACVLDEEFDADGLATLRGAVDAAASHSAIGGEEAVEELALVAHELATNAVRHGGGRGRLRLWVAEGRFWCSVSDWGPGLSDPESRGTRLPSPEVPGGRGLWIARRMSDLTIRTSSSGTVVTAAIPQLRSGNT